MNMPSLRRWRRDESAVMLPHSSIDEKSVELPLKFLCPSNDDKPTHPHIQALRDVKRLTEDHAQLVQNVFCLIIDGRMNWDFRRLLNDDKTVFAVHDRGAPVDITYGISLRIKMYPDILTRPNWTIAMHALAIDVNRAELQQPFCGAAAQSGLPLQTLQQCCFIFGEVMTDSAQGFIHAC